MIYYTCLVCGYDRMTSPPEFWNICPCCGTEFENHDYYKSHPQLRREWIDAGMRWFSHVDKPPRDWNPVLQLIRADYGADLINPSGEKVRNTQTDIQTGHIIVWSQFIVWSQQKPAQVDTAKGIGYAQVTSVLTV